MGVTKTKVLIAVIVLLAVVFCGCSTSLSSGKSSSMTMSVKTTSSLTETKKKPVTFEEAQVLKFTYSSKVKDGTLVMRLLKADGSVLESFEVNKSGKHEIKIEKKDTYVIEVDCEQFIGSYHLKWETVKTK